MIRALVFAFLVGCTTASVHIDNEHAERASAATTRGLRLNEVVVRKGDEAPWIELYNDSNDTATLDAYELASLDRTQRMPLSSVVVAGRAYAVVPASIDLDRDGGVQLLFGGQLVDEVAWTFSGTPPAGPEFKAFAEDGTPRFLSFNAEASARLRWLPRAGETVGRSSTGEWGVLGGSDAAGATPGEGNVHPLAAWASGLAPDTPGRSLAPTRDTSPAKWTVMVFADAADREAASFVAKYLEEASKVGSSSDVRFVAQVSKKDRAARWELTRGLDWNAGKLAFARDEAQSATTAEGLAAFVGWARAAYPAEHYALVMIGHGDGWKGINAWEHDVLSMAELRAGLAGGALDVLFMNSCLMGGLEVAKQVQGLAPYWVASEEVMWASYEWKPWLQLLHDTPTTEASALADAMAQAYAAGMSEQRTFTIASLQLGELDVAMKAMNTWAAALKHDMDDVKERRKRDDNANVLVSKKARQAAEKFTHQEYKDLVHLVSLVGALPLTAAPLSADVVTAMTALVRFERHGAAHPNAHGLSLFFPRNLLQSPADDRGFDDTFPATHSYALDADIKVPAIRGAKHARDDDAAFLFPAASEWDEFLHRFYKPTSDACIVRGRSCVKDVTLFVGQKTDVTGAGSSDGDPQSGTHIERYWWDLDATVDNPGPQPAYVENERYEECTEDCDRDGVDSLTDDPDATGATIEWRCKEPTSRSFTLSVWDEHHTNGRRHEEGPHNEGRHWLHFNEHHDTVTLTCLDKKTSALPSRSSVSPGEDLEYLAHVVPQNGDSVSVVLALPFALTVDTARLSCPEPAEVCAYDAATHTVHYSGLAPADGATLSVWTELPADATCTPLRGLATLFDGVNETKVKLVTKCVD